MYGMLLLNSISSTYIISSLKLPLPSPSEELCVMVCCLDLPSPSSQRRQAPKPSKAVPMQPKQVPIASLAVHLSVWGVTTPASLQSLVTVGTAVAAGKEIINYIFSYFWMNTFYETSREMQPLSQPQRPFPGTLNNTVNLYLWPYNWYLTLCMPACHHLSWSSSPH